MFSCLAIYGQDINSFRTINSGNFSDIGIWETFDGFTWNPAVSTPNSTNDIYIDQTHTLNLLGDQSVKSLFINAETGAGEKLNLNGNALEVFGTLQAFSGAAPGTPSGTWNSINWIGNSIDSRIIFKGNSRTIIPNGAWSGFATQSRYTVIFDPGNGEVLTIEEPIKSMRFIFRSGTVIQKIDTSVNPATCPTLSFNSENSFGTDDFGDLIIEGGAIFISECDEDIVFRSNTRSASLFEIRDGGELILEGDNPAMEVVQYVLDGKVTFAAGITAKSFIDKSFPTSSFANNFHDLELRSSQNLALPGNLSITGDLIQSSTGNFDFASTNLEFTGSGEQRVIGFPLIVFNLSLDKANGEVSLEQDLTVLSNLQMLSGGLNLNQNSLSINLLGTGGLDYSGGYWRDLADFTYFQIPGTLTASNFTLPFLDQFQGGIRKIQLLGSGPTGNLTVNFTEFLGADTDPQFDDSDGTTILYRLFSYFQFSGLTPSSDVIEMRISGDELIVNDVDDLRIVGTGYAAPGTNLPGIDPIELWARRSISYQDLEGPNFTIGSFRTLSILPVTWLGVETQISKRGTFVEWEVASEKDNEKFEIYRSDDGKGEWSKIGETASLGDSNNPRIYTFLDSTRLKFQHAYYQIRQIDFDGKDSWSEVILSEKVPTPNLQINPNPYHSGKISIVVPGLSENETIYFSIIGIGGQMIKEGNGTLKFLEDYMTALPQGLYIIKVHSSTSSYLTRWIKR
ncbi:T9SS type A sorting domain-containing protein [Algoriphagus sediminis]|uniref:T9SS type A sorting domain-containing protein n=1 Tax=Algoriphagus sediminis TaxID=3057113 RepID=A0ABT7YE86_9BACT|nr:T9SS type A sorting domain-containing protein [Algoriphagus sediminis]MDN3204833.1 T9SS type A sorting domain-containing protein [Algoriphagus sediminis]